VIVGSIKFSTLRLQAAMAATLRVALLLLSIAPPRASAEPNQRNGDPVTNKPFTDEVKQALFKSGSDDIKWVLALNLGACDEACGGLHCSEDMFAKVNSRQAFAAILESIENAPGCTSYKVDTQYGVAPFIWEDESMCWVSDDSTGTTCHQEPDKQFLDVRLCPCKKNAGKHVAHEATDAVESSPSDQAAALALGKEKALQNLLELRSNIPGPSWLPASRAMVSAIALAAVAGTIVSGMIGFVAWRASRQDDSTLLLAISEDWEEGPGLEQSNEC